MVHLARLAGQTGKEILRQLERAEFLYLAAQHWADRGRRISGTAGYLQPQSGARKQRSRLSSPVVFRLVVSAPHRPETEIVEQRRPHPLANRRLAVKRNYLHAFWRSADSFTFAGLHQHGFGGPKARPRRESLRLLDCGEPRMPVQQANDSVLV